MGAPGAASQGRGRAVGLFAAFAALTLAVAASPLLLSPPVDVRLSGPTLVPAQREAVFRGEFTAAGVGLGGRTVEVFLDGNPLATVVTEDDGSFAFTVSGKRAGAHVLAAVAARGEHVEARSGELRFRAVLPPLAPTGLGVSGSTLSWRLPPADEDRPVQEIRVYVQAPGSPWQRLGSVEGDRTSFDLPQTPSGRHQLAVVALNVAGESEWASMARG